MITPVKNRQCVSDESEDEDDEEKRTLFCANLDERVTDDLLYEVFLQAGPIESARIPKDSSGRQRSFGFITYVHACTIPYAMQLFQGLSLFRKTLTIKFQGNTNTNRSPMGHNISPGYNHKRSSYDNSSLRGSNYMSYNDAPPLNPFKMNYSPDFPLSSMMPQQNVSKHATSQKRAHSNASPYNRNSSGNDDRQRERERDRERDRDRDRDRDRERDHDRRRHYNNGSNRHSDQRSGGKSRR